MPRSNSRNPMLEQRWRRLLSRWERSARSVRDFCADHAISEASFYAWRRELAVRDRERAATAPAAPRPTPALIPVRVVATTPLEVVLPGGLVVRVPGGADPAAVAQLVAALRASPC
jgi:hypothetical protein